ncbi:MAG: site-specific DNA-methyltransferase [Pseudomonadota bacterium]|nr:site-specific DNA-methyltransferase [Pseudomonadota bacterium]MDP1904138.1 site-specific DNA-methyltransferase [Pseudomonadota bacterium]MDP2353765.1 site-specific DNA-methyltransferase [Pseudomonadota bacterium]
MSTEEKRQQLRRQLIAKLREMFQMDQADLDFGIYRIMNAKRDEVERFLEHDLLPTLRATLEQFQPAGQADKQNALEKAIEAAKLAGFDPEQSPKVQQLRAELAETVDLDRLEEQVYSDLHTFFSRYYQNGDFMSLRRYKEGVYALPYEGEEVKLHWANADQYYIKSAENFTRYAFKTPQGRVRFELAAAGTERDNNKATGEGERRFILCDAPVSVEDGELVIRFAYRPDPDKRKQKELNALAVESLLGLPALSLPHVADWPQWRAALAAPLPTDKNKTRTTLEKHLNDYSAKNTFDYFIHKDLGSFLRRELDFFIKNEVMHLDDIEEQTAPAVEQYLARIKAMRRIAHKLIAFLAQLENFQKKLWLKKKFVLETNWLITLDRIDARHYPEICRQAETPVRGWDGATRNQREEWVKLFAIDEILPAAPKPGTGGEKQLFEQTAPPYGRADLFQFRHSGESRNPVKSTTWTPAFAGVTDISALPYSIPLTPEFLQANPFLVLDTAFFDASLKDTLLGDIENLDEQTNGLLVHGENFQALNLLRERYREQVKCIYIDPPFNTELDRKTGDFIYKDTYEHSSWVSMMDGRVDLARNLLRAGGALAVHINDVEDAELCVCLTKGGRFNLLNKISVKTKSPSGFKTVNRGLFETTEYINVFEQSNSPAGCNDGFVPCEHDTNYSKIVLNKEAEPISWEIGSCQDEASRMLGYSSPIVSRKKLGKEVFAKEVERYSIDNAERVFRLTEIDDQGAGKDTVDIKRLSKMQPGKVFTVERQGYGHRYIINGKEITFYSKKVKMIDGVLTPTTTITNFWGDIAWEGIALEGGVSLSQGKKPEKLLERILSLFSDKSDTILDFFCGSGTTPAVAHKLKRRWIGIESGAHFDYLARTRITKTIAGKTGGIKSHASYGLAKYLRLESYEDTCDNLALARSDTQQTLIDQAPALREGYFLNYLLDIESRASLLNLDKFSDPFNVALSITRNDETREVKVDMAETFNYLLGLRVKTQRRLKGVYEVTGTTPAGDRALILWRNVAEVDNDALDDWFRAYNTRDREFDLIYVNGDNNLENLRRPDETWKVRLIEETFHTLMFAVEEV